MRYAVDVQFQQANRPGGTLEESKSYFNGKHKLHWYKVEVSVLSKGIAIACIDRYPGSISDIDIFQKMQYLHVTSTEKSEGEERIVYLGELEEECNISWAINRGKGDIRSKSLSEIGTLQNEERAQCSITG